MNDKKPEYYDFVDQDGTIHRIFGEVFHTKIAQVLWLNKAELRYFYLPKTNRLLVKYVTSNGQLKIYTLTNNWFNNDAALDIVEAFINKYPKQNIVKVFGMPSFEQLNRVNIGGTNYFVRGIPFFQLSTNYRTYHYFYNDQLDQVIVLYWDAGIICNILSIKNLDNLKSDIKTAFAEKFPHKMKIIVYE